LLEPIVVMALIGIVFSPSRGSRVFFLTTPSKFPLADRQAQALRERADAPLQVLHIDLTPAGYRGGHDPDEADRAVQRAQRCRAAAGWSWICRRAKSVGINISFRGRPPSGC
jgi:hypothetical protein